ncbi:MAG TPA: DUF1080 domain-containing protein [Pirellulales bacterium]|nr:DUF1080 domain-containing protein [Pirellulales bacterium]
MHRSLIFRALTLLAAFSVAASLHAADKGLPTFTDATSAGPDFAVQGEYSGEIETRDGKVKHGVQVIALGEGKFRAVAYRGGLPGDGWEKDHDLVSVDGSLNDGVAVFKGEHARGEIKDGALAVTSNSGDKLGELKKVERKSPTLGQKPPAGAVVLFDGTNPEAWKDGKLTGSSMIGAGLLEVGTQTKQSFGSCQLHLEFRTPFMPTARGQARGNSGVYMEDTYEFQVLDSFGLEGKDNECGGLYSIQAPQVNMCYPPLSWQTYDFDFTAPKFDADGKKIANARVTLKHNGVLIYDDFELPKQTPGGRGKEGGPGSIALQNHGNPVNYRNIWLVEKK